jgi:hypothetical protein
VNDRAPIRAVTTGCTVGRYNIHRADGTSELETVWTDECSAWRENFYGRRSR